MNLRNSANLKPANLKTAYTKKLKPKNMNTTINEQLETYKRGNFKHY